MNTDVAQEAKLEAAHPDPARGKVVDNVAPRKHHCMEVN